MTEKQLANNGAKAKREKPVSQEDKYRLDVSKLREDVEQFVGHNPKWSVDDIMLIHDMTARDATFPEFKAMLYIAAENELDPLKKQIWCYKMKKNEPAIITIARDGYLLIAHRTGRFKGMKTEVKRIEEPFTVDIWVYRGDKRVLETKSFDHQYVATTRIWTDNDSPDFPSWEHTVYEEEYNKGTANWLTKRRTMIQKVAESQLLRRAFEIGHGTYSPEEIVGSRADFIKTDSGQVYEIQGDEIVALGESGEKKEQEKKPEPKRAIDPLAKVTVLLAAAGVRDASKQRDLIYYLSGSTKLNTKQTEELIDLLERPDASDIIKQALQDLDEQTDRYSEEIEDAQ